MACANGRLCAETCHVVLYDYQEVKTGHPEVTGWRSESTGPEPCHLSVLAA